MKTTVNHEEFYTLIKLGEARLDNESSGCLRPLVEDTLARGKSNIILDLGMVNYLDSAGFSAILVANRMCLEMDGELILVNPQENIKRLIRMAHLEEIINLRVNLWDAIGNLLAQKAS